MENLIIGIIIFLITAVIQYFIKKNKAEKERGHTQSKNPHTFFDEIKEKFEKAMNPEQVSYMEKPKTVYKKEIKKPEIKQQPVINSENADVTSQLTQKDKNSFLKLEYINPIDKINKLPMLQKAYIWKEIFDKPAALKSDDQEIF